MHYIVRIFDEHLALCVCALLCFSDVFIQVSIFKNMQVDLEDYIAGPASQMKIYLKMHNVT